MIAVSAKKKKNFFKEVQKNYTANKWVYWMALPVVLFYVVFHYFPMFGLVSAFENFKPSLGYLGSKWVGLQHFVDFLTGEYAWRLIRNTVVINFYLLVFGFPLPIIFALLLNEIKLLGYKKVVQTFSYLPHFISAVVVCGMLVEFSETGGIFNDVRAALGMNRINMLSDAKIFRPLYVSSAIWQGLGWDSIIYIATISSADPTLYEAAEIDGANRFQRVIHVTLPVLIPLIVMQLILKVGKMMSLGYEKVLLLYNPLTYETSDIISTYVYRRGLLETNYSLGSAVGMFNSIVNLILVITANTVSRKVADESLW